MPSLIYTLTMPGRNTWNGKWSGDDRVHALVRHVPKTKKAMARAERIVAEGPYSYAWNDGWRASVSARLATGPEVTKARRTSAGFCGYDWMVDSIERHGEILTRDEAKAKREAVTHADR